MTDPAQDRAEYVCHTCRVRKKKCDKTLPRCTYCADRMLECRYLPLSSYQNSAHSDSQSAYLEVINVPNNLALVAHPSDSGSLRSISLSGAGDRTTQQVYRLVKSTGIALETLPSLFFQGPQVPLPFVPQPLFESRLAQFPHASPPDFNILVLAACLICFNPEVHSCSRKEHDALHVATRMLITHAQTVLRPSMALIQATVVVALYEYASYDCNVALTTLSTAVRMAHEIGLNHVFNEPNPEFNELSPEHGEAISLWWALVICERMFVMDSRNPGQPLLSKLPSAGHLPAAWTSDQSRPWSGGTGDVTREISPLLLPPRFMGAAQAAVYLDSMLAITAKRNLDRRDFAALNATERDLRTFAGDMLTRVLETGRVYCSGIAMCLRGLLFLHTFSLREPLGGRMWGDGVPEEEGRAASLLALDTVTQIMSDVMGLHSSCTAETSVESVPPTSMYVLDAGLAHLGSGATGATAKKRASAALLSAARENIERRWGVRRKMAAAAATAAAAEGNDDVVTSAARYCNYES